MRQTIQRDDDIENTLCFMPPVIVIVSTSCSGNKCYVDEFLHARSSPSFV